MLLVEDGPTLTHGEMKSGASEIEYPHPWTVGSKSDSFRKYPNIGTMLPTMGYGDKQVKDLEATMNKVPCDAVIIGMPIDLSRLIKIRKLAVRERYELQEIGEPDPEDVLMLFLKPQRR